MVETRPKRPFWKVNAIGFGRGGRKLNAKRKNCDCVYYTYDAEIKLQDKSSWRYDCSRRGEKSITATSGQC